MTNPIISTYDHLTGQTTNREMTDNELQAQQTRAAAQAEEQAAKLAAREAVLNKLGLSAHEAAALFG